MWVKSKPPGPQVLVTQCLTHRPLVSTTCCGETLGQTFQMFEENHAWARFWEIFVWELMLRVAGCLECPHEPCFSLRPALRCSKRWRLGCVLAQIRLHGYMLGGALRSPCAGQYSWFARFQFHQQRMAGLMDRHASPPRPQATQALWRISATAGRGSRVGSFQWVQQAFGDMGEQSECRTEYRTFWTE